MKKIEVNATDQEILRLYEELKSSYKVAKKLQISATAIKRILRNLGVLRTQSSAAKDRGVDLLQYERTTSHRQALSERAKARVGEKNPFFGKSHTENVKRKLSESATKRTKTRNPNFKDGKYQRRPRDFKQAEFTRLRNFIFNKDEYTCFYCNHMGGHLHAHHRIPYWVCSEAYLDIENLITVCSKCHLTKAHKGSWCRFDVDLVTNSLLKKYTLNRERLNELAGHCPDAIVRTSDIDKTEELSGNKKAASDKR